MEIHGLRQRLPRACRALIRSPLMMDKKLLCSLFTFGKIQFDTIGEIHFGTFGEIHFGTFGLW